MCLRIRSRNTHTRAFQMVEQTIGLLLFEPCYSTTSHSFVAHPLSNPRSLLGLPSHSSSVFEATVFRQETRYPRSIFAHEKIMLLGIIVGPAWPGYSAAGRFLTTTSTVAKVQRLGVRTMLQPPMARMRAATGRRPIFLSALVHGKGKKSVLTAVSEVWRGCETSALSCSA